MLRFECDYLEGADERVLDALCKTNSVQTCGYGEDAYCEKARALIREQCNAPEADVHFFVGGTQVNYTVIAAALRPFEGVLAATTGHINVHETGAVEATGHKVLALPEKEGKITAEQVETAVVAHRTDGTHEHMVSPAMVYISHPTELGTLYTKRELTDLWHVCQRYGLTLYIDGARLGYGLAADDEVDLPFLSAHCDAFTIGGTKVGALFGEALVLTSDALKPCFRYHIKQRGALLAKGRLLGVQFQALMEGGHYIEIARRANALAQKLKNDFVAKGYSLLCDTVTNQIFPILPDEVYAELAQRYSFSFWAKTDETHTAVRFCAGVMTRGEAVEELMEAIPRLH